MRFVALVALVALVAHVAYKQGQRLFMLTWTETSWLIYALRNVGGVAFQSSEDSRISEKNI